LDGGAAVRFVELSISDCQLPMELATEDRVFIRCFRTSDFGFQTPRENGQSAVMPPYAHCVSKTRRRKLALHLSENRQSQIINRK
jgi:hypothetical protein